MFGRQNRCSFGGRDVDESARARDPPRPDHAHARPDEAQQVVNRVPRLHVAALGVDEHGDVRIGLRGERQELCRDGGRELLADLSTDDDGPGPKQALADGIGDSGGWALGFVLAEHVRSPEVSVRLKTNHAVPAPRQRRRWPTTIRHRRLDAARSLANSRTRSGSW